MNNIKCSVLAFGDYHNFKFDKIPIEIHERGEKYILSKVTRE
jgi:hypothetical protein